MSGRCCPGCGAKPIAAYRLFCPPCEGRAPKKMQEALSAARARLDRATAEVADWLRTHPKVTRRELEVIELVSHGLENADIAARLHVSEETVKSTLRDVGQRWGCRGRGSRAQIVATAFRLGYLQTTRTEQAI
ncbi:response regulator transcription factor [Nonomuraea sp. CA-218870]|uniref:response regulator transcription factor n=1 Tax=Nonomuraea sp. CA-218870 TaxID=3239998 RepID=UPI003D8B74CA